MARKDAEIAALKAGIPARFQPSPDMGGKLVGAFGDTGSLREPALIYEGDTSHNARQAPDSDNPLASDRAREMAGMTFAGDAGASLGFMLTGAQMTIAAHGEGKTEQQKRDSERMILDQLRAQLDARLAELDEELRQIDERLEEIRQRRLELGDGLEALDELERLAASGQLDPSNPAHAALLRRAGIDPDEARQRDFRDIIAQRRNDMSREDGALEDDWNTSMKRRGEVVRAQEDVKAARAEIESADTSEAIEKAAHRAHTVLGTQQLGKAAYLTDGQQAQVIAADAVAQAERANVRAESEDYNRQAAGENVDATFNVDDESFADDAPRAKPALPSPT